MGTDVDIYRGNMSVVCTDKTSCQTIFKQQGAKTNTDALIGQTALVKETINNMESKGLVQLNGQDWTARSFEAGEIIPEGSEVIVKETEA